MNLFLDNLVEMNYFKIWLDFTGCFVHGKLRVAFCYPTATTKKNISSLNPCERAEYPIQKSLPFLNFFWRKLNSNQDNWICYQMSSPISVCYFLFRLHNFSTSSSYTEVLDLLWKLTTENLSLIFWWSSHRIISKMN